MKQSIDLFAHLIMDIVPPFFVTMTIITLMPVTESYKKHHPLRSPLALSPIAHLQPTDLRNKLSRNHGKPTLDSLRRLPDLWNL